MPTTPTLGSVGTFISEWGLAITITMAVLALLIWAEWRDHRDGLYDDDTPDAEDLTNHDYDDLYR